MRLETLTIKRWWMSDLCRAPEVLSKLPCDFPVDVWSVGVMVNNELRLFRGRFNLLITIIRY